MSGFVGRAEPSAPEVNPTAESAGVPVTSPPDNVLHTGPAWGGWYLGGHVGYAHGMANTTLSNSAPPNATSSFGSLYGGALVGYAVQLPARLVLGLEADVSFPNFRDDDDLISSRQTSGGSVAERLDLLGRVRGRLGYAFDRWLLYGAGGFAWSLGRFIQSLGPAAKPTTRASVSAQAGR